MSASSLVLNPKLLIADEPTTALDVTIQQQIVTLVRRLQGETGMGVLWVSHDLGGARPAGPVVLVMYAGHVVEAAAVQQLFGSLAHRYSAGLLASLRSLDDDRGRLHQIPGPPPRGRRWHRGALVRTALAAGPRPARADAADGRPRARPHRGLLVPQGCEGADVLSVQDLHKSYPARGGGSVQAVGGISFDVPEATSLRVVGESGCGKSMMARMLVGLEGPTSGPSLSAASRRSADEARGRGAVKCTSSSRTRTARSTTG